MKSVVIKYEMHNFGYLWYNWKDGEISLARSKVQTLLYGLKKAKNFAKRNEVLQLSLAALHDRCKFEVRSLAYDSAVNI